jgi:hypothetical protein
MKIAAAFAILLALTGCAPSPYLFQAIAIKIALSK